MMGSEPPFTFGIEEEYHLVDLDTRALRAGPPGFIEACQARLGGGVSPEFLATQVEIGTSVCRTFREARAEIARLRSGVGEIAATYGMAPIAAGTHPFSPAGGLPTTDRERYRVLAADLAGVGHRMAISGMHVHVGLTDNDLRIDLMNQARYFVPHLLVMSASSPFWDGRDTGLKSYRLSVIDEMPRTGLPGRFSSWDEFEETINVLVRAGVIEDATKVWWDLRPSVRFPTLEMRVTDVTTRIDDGMAVAALYVCILRMLWRLRRGNLSWRTYPVFLLEENRWRAQRYGVGGRLFDFGKGVLVPFSDLIEELLALVAEDAAALGCEAEVARCRRIVAEGTSADRQVAAYQAALSDGKTNAAALEAVVDMLIAETLAV